MFRILFGVSALALLGCSTTQVGLKYQAVEGITPANAPESISVGSFVDKRGESSTWIGAIRGNPLKNVESEKPVAALVHTAFEDALRARGVSLGTRESRYQIAGTVKKLDFDQAVRREANVEIEVTVIDLASGQQRFARTYNASNVDGSLVSPKIGIFASVEDLRGLTEKTLDETVDKALDDSSLRAALMLR